MAENETSYYFALQGSVHIVSSAEYTLCGDALEGDEGDAEGMYVVPQRITCERCVEVIEHAKSIQANITERGNRDMAENEAPERLHKCSWVLDDFTDGDLWETECGQSFQFNDGGPKENKFRFCYYCGKSIEASRYSDESGEGT